MIRTNKAIPKKINKNAHQEVIPLALITLLALTAPAGVMAAQPEDALNFVVGAGFRYEDNLFRIDDDTDPRLIAGKSRRSDLISTYTAGIKIDKEYSLQRFQLDLTAIKNDYQTYDYLDFTAKNYRAAWLWSLTPDLTGTILLDRQQVQNNFADFLTEQNQVIQRQSLQTNEIRSATADWDIGAGIHLLGGVSQTRSRNDTVFNAVGDYEQTGAEFGVKYVARSENFISLVQRESNGEYRGRALDPFGQFDTGFDQSETELLANMRVSGKSQIEARLGYIDREHDNFEVRDYSGMTGMLAHIWTPTGKLRITTSLSRNLASFQQFFNSYYISETFAIAPVWAITAKTRIRARLSYSEREYRGALPGVVNNPIFVPEGELREDKVHGLTVSAEWEPTRTVLITGTLQHEKRNSNFDSFGLDYDANSVGISGQLLF
jgi:exopolysaccharide biosynthesis operon protein EpsL